MDDTVREMTLRELIKSRSITATSAVGQHGGFCLSVACGDRIQVLGSTRGLKRIFPNLTSLAVYLHRLGISRFEVDTTHYRAARVRPARPDRADALKRTRTKPQQADLLQDVS